MSAGVTRGSVEEPEELSPQVSYVLFSTARVEDLFYVVEESLYQGLRVL